MLAVRATPPPGGDFAVYAALAGLAGAVGLAAFYRGLTVGAMGIVAPISATAAAIPVVVGVASGERPSSVQAVGLGLALAGVALASREGGNEAGRGSPMATGVGLALLAALGFGSFFLAIDQASDADVLWGIFGARVTSVTLIAAVCVVRRPRLAVTRDDGAKLAVVGLLDVGANLAFAYASTQGLVSIVAVLGSLYPVVTVVLAHAVLHERVAGLQRFGAATALGGVALISAG